ncbi:MAG: DEAD/DEAH box helicase [Acidobacteria bacterium]|nr:MAG: DEAD/DEAH box helicase [Acidobacteriota bacterium]
MKSAIELFHPAVQRWFYEKFSEPTRAQTLAWPVIEKGEHALILAPTGSGKTLAAFLSALNHVMFMPLPPKKERCRVLYISPLKALAFDVERNLRIPIAGITAAAVASDRLIIPSVAIRTGDTPTAERAQFVRRPSDLLITTPESLYLLLTSNAREALRSIRWVIVDEIHAMAGNKRGAHLAVSLERLEALTSNSFQRIGLSATQRPLDEVSRFLGGGEVKKTWQPRPVTIVDAGGTKDLDIQVVVPIEDMAQPDVDTNKRLKGPAKQGVSQRSIWPSIYPEVLRLIREHHTTLIFTNNRRLAERMAAALNELAGEELVRAHHGSVAREQRVEIEEQLKAGKLPAIVATSSLELGIDMGSIDLVIQIESPTSVASALQRIGRAGHQLHASSKGIIFPKYRGDLVASAALAKLALTGTVEETRYPRNPLDVLAQQIVAMASMDRWKVDELEGVIRRAAPFADLTRSVLENVLDMLSGRYPSDEFSDLRPRIVWDRIGGTIRARSGAKAIAIASGGTIPDRGLFRVMLAGAEPGKGRVGELDEEMVFETRTGETFLLGSSTWRVEEITQDRVIVSPAPGEPGKMPFWRGDTAGRPIDFGKAIGQLIRQLKDLPAEKAAQMLTEQHRLNPFAASNLLKYLVEQEQRGGAIPDDQTIVIERYTDDLGDLRICILSPFGGKVHAPWTHAIEAAIRGKENRFVETLWSDDGIIIRLPDLEDPPALEKLIPDPDEVEELVMRQLGSSALFSAHFREAAARALLLPRRYPGQRTPLWHQRRRAFDLLSVTAKYPTFPIILEAHRELLRDFFDIPALAQLLRDIRSRVVRVVTIDSQSPSPFASSLMFGYVGNFIYEGDAPLAERRAQALSVDHTLLRELLGEAELRDLLDPAIIANVEAQLQHLDPNRKITNADALHDLLLRLGDLADKEILLRSAASTNTVKTWINELESNSRIVSVEVGKQNRWIAAEDAGRYKDALKVKIEARLPRVFLEKVADPIGDLIGRYARTRGPFSVELPATRFGISSEVAERALRSLELQGRVASGEFQREGKGREWSDAGVLRIIRQKSLAKIRREVEPVEPAAYGRFLPEWHRIGSNRKGQEALLEAIEQLQGYPMPASVLEDQILTARVKEYDSGELDALLSSGVVVWSGVEPLGETDGRITLYLAEHASRLLHPPESAIKLTDVHQRIVEFLSSSGASFYPQILAASGIKYGQELIAALWDLVWAGEITNDTLIPLRALLHSKRTKKKRAAGAVPGRVSIPPEASGRWSLIRNIISGANTTERLHAVSWQLLERLGVVSREAMAAERVQGGFSAIYPVFKALEETGKIRRGYFIAGRGAAQFALPGALERLRAFRDPKESPVIQVLASTDPANPFGASLKWPQREDNLAAGRVTGSQVILVDGELAAYWSRTGRSILTYGFPEQVARALAELVDSGKRKAIFLNEVDGRLPEESIMAGALKKEGFVAYSQGWQRRSKHVLYTSKERSHET